MRDLILKNKNEIEGLVVFSENQTDGKGQRGNSWITERGKNLTFSLFLKPSILISTQFVLSKIVSLSIVDFLMEMGVKDVKIKWPNDIYCGDKKIAGILIENTISEGKINNCIVGIGLNVNQVNFDSSIQNATSLKLELGFESINLN